MSLLKTQELEVNASTEKITTISPDPVTEYNIEHFQAILGIFGLDERDVVPLQHDPAQLLLSVHLRGVVQHQVHVLIKSRDVTLNPCIDILIEPDRDSGPVLEVAEDEVDGLHHHLLNLLAATVAHLFSQ